MPSRRRLGTHLDYWFPDLNQGNRRAYGRTARGLAVIALAALAALAYIFADSMHWHFARW